MTELDRLQEIHKKLRMCRYFYYEMHDSKITDREYDFLEKEYTELADRLGINEKHRIDRFVGFSIMIPMDLRNFKAERKTNRK